MRNIFDQDLNRTSNVTFSNITIIDRIFLDANEEHWISSNASLVYDGGGSLAKDTFWLNHEEEHTEADSVFIVSTINRTIIWASIGRNSSASTLGNSWAIIPNNLSRAFIESDGKINITKLISCQLMIEGIGQTPRIGCDTFESGADFFVQDDIQLGGRLFASDGVRSQGDANFFMKGNDFNIFNGTLHIQEPVFVETGFEIGENATILNANFDEGSLNPFYNFGTASNSVRDWIDVSSVNCDIDACARSIGGETIIRTMETNVTTTDFDSLILNFSVTTLAIEPADLLRVTVNNNVGSGEIELFSTSTNLAGIVQNISLPATMDDQPVMSIRFHFNANGGGEQAFIDSVLLTATATGSTTIIIETFNARILLVDENEILWNDTTKRLSLPSTDFLDTGDLIVKGDINVTGCIQEDDGTLIGGTCISGREYKENEVNLTINWSQFNGVVPKTWTWKEGELVVQKSRQIDGRTYYYNETIKLSYESGFIYEDVLQYYPERTTNEFGLKQVEYDFNWLLDVRTAVQDLFKWNTQQDDDIDNIKECARLSRDWEVYQTCIAGV